MNSFIYNTDALGPITLADNGAAIVRFSFGSCPPRESVLQETPLLKQAYQQLCEYLQGKRQCFDLPLSLEGTAFQQRVWTVLLQIPYGETRSYKQIALAVGQPKAFRAVGGANNRNPIAVFIPCHRVVGADGAMVGFGGGLSMKQALLTLEQVTLHPPNGETT